MQIERATSAAERMQMKTLTETMAIIIIGLDIIGPSGVDLFLYS